MIHPETMDTARTKFLSSGQSLEREITEQQFK
jgi:hypothetical protein